MAGAAEAEVMDALRPFAIAPGDYMMPNCSDMAQMRTLNSRTRCKGGRSL